MKHNFTYKLIDKINLDILEDLKQYVIQGPWEESNDFKEYTIRLKNFRTIDPPVQRLFDTHMSKFFGSGAHIGSNVAKMVPGGYVPEHSDYTANTYGKMQDSIIKFQIPIITNSGCGLCWKWDPKFKAEGLFLEEGGIYMFDNCRVHSSVNLGSTDRYWITSRWKADALLDPSILD